MSAFRQKRILVLAGCVLLVLVASLRVALATHSWGGYHWARTTPQFTLKIGDNMSGDWTPYLSKASSDWNSPLTWGWTGAQPLLTAIVAGQSNRNCKMVAGTTQVCNANYGFNGWLGLATINITGG